MSPTGGSQTDAVLREWRVGILNRFLAIVAVTGAAMIAAGIVDAISRPGELPSMILYSALELLLVALALLRKIDSRLRAWGVLMVPFAIAVTVLMSSGLTGSGRLYLLALPIGAVILIGIRSGILMAALRFSKIEAGKMDLEQQPFDLRECLEAALDLVKMKAAEKSLELACEIAPHLPQAVVGDVTRLRQILVNLLGNAVKFTDQGEVVVTASSEWPPQATQIPKLTPPNTLTLHFTVCDTGIGIPPERLDRLFQAFSQVDASTTRKYGGTGLGLAVSKRLSEEYRQEVTLW